MTRRVTDLAATRSPSLCPSAGCFWSVELIYQREPGVLRTEVGYTGGHKENPTYRETCTGTTGHAEAVQLVYDPAVVSFGRLLDIFFEKHDPTTKDRQGGDVGSQYRSAIFFHDEAQKTEATERCAAETKKIGKQVVTEIAPMTKWYPAEEYVSFTQTRSSRQAHATLHEGATNTATERRIR